MLSWLLAVFLLSFGVCTLFVERLNCCVFLQVFPKKSAQKMEETLKADVGVILESLNNGNFFAEMYYPTFIDTEQKYNEVIRKTSDLDSFMKLILDVAADPLVTPSRLMTLTKAMERDLNLVHNKTVFKSFLMVVESVMNCMKLEGVING